MASAPTVSVIIPAYRVAQYITDAIDSILKQTFKDYEIVVVNDGCPETDQLERVLAPYRSQITYIRQENAGVGAARHTAVLAARGDLITQLDPDDWWEPNYLQVQMEHLNRDPSLGFVYPDGWFFGDPALEGKRLMRFNPSHGEVTFSNLAIGRVSVVYSVLARKDAIMQAGNFDPAIRTSEDFDLWLRILNAGYKAAYHHTPLLHYRIRRGSLTSNSLSTHTWAIRVIEKLESSLQLTAEEKDSLLSRRKSIETDIDLLLGKKAVEERDWTRAQEHLRRVLESRPNRKLSAALWMLRWCPAAVAAALNTRDALLEKGILRAQPPTHAHD
jgi:glycosyltransferase involved in cell wall biosynthesis